MMAEYRDEQGRWHVMPEDFWPEEAAEAGAHVAVVTWGEERSWIPAVFSSSSKEGLDRQLVISINGVLGDNDGSVGFTRFLEDHPLPLETAPYEEVEAWLAALDAECEYPVIDRFPSSPASVTGSDSWWASLAESPVPDILEGLFPPEPQLADATGSDSQATFEAAMEDWREETLQVARELRVLAGNASTWHPLHDQLEQAITTYDPPSSDRQGIVSDAAASEEMLGLLSRMRELLDDLPHPSPRHSDSTTLPARHSGVDAGSIHDNLGHILDTHSLPAAPDPRDFLSISEGEQVASVDIRGYVAKEKAWRTDFDKAAHERLVAITALVTRQSSTPFPSHLDHVSLEEGALLSDLLEKRQALLDRTPPQRHHQAEENGPTRDL